MKDIEKLLTAYETDVTELTGMGRFEALNMFTNRDILEEQKSKMTTLQSARLLFADEKLLANIDLIIAECGGEAEFVKLRSHHPAPSAWWWYLEQIPLAQFTNDV